MGYSSALIAERANANKPKMGLTSFQNSDTTGKVLKSDTQIAKNYLTEDEVRSLNDLVSMYLDHAINLAKRNKIMTMQDWVDRLDAFLQFNEYELLDNLGSISSKVAKINASKEFEKFRKIQDKHYKSDFEEVIMEIKQTGKLPTPPHERFSVQKSGIDRNLSDSNPKDRPVSALSISSIKKRKEHKKKKDSEG